MWDNRWAWGLPYLPRPSWVWAAWVAIKIFGQGDRIYEWQELSFTFIAATLFARQWLFEDVRYMPFTLDEESFRIGNYFKRR